MFRAPSSYGGSATPYTYVSANERCSIMDNEGYKLNLFFHFVQPMNVQDESQLSRRRRRLGSSARAFTRRRWRILLSITCLAH